MRRREGYEGRGQGKREGWEIKGKRRRREARDER